MDNNTKTAVLEELKKLTTEYCLTLDGRWLIDIEWRKIPVSFEKMDNDIVGYYYFGKIGLKECLEAHALFPTYIHELRHRYQLVRNPIKYLIGKFYRPLIERDAEACENHALNWLLDRNQRG